MTLVILIGKEKSGFGQVTALLNRFETDQIILVKDISVTDFPSKEKSQILEVNFDSDLVSLKEEMKSKLQKVLNKEFEVALSIASGTGKEHMAIISALLSIPVGVKIVAYTKNGVEFLS